MLLNAEKSCLLLVDVQEKLLPAIHNHEQLLSNCRWMLQVAEILQIPVLVSEQYPKGLGPTVEPLKKLVPPDVYVEKLHFSCADDENCLKRINALDRPQIVIIGIETHVCVLQTALGLLMEDKEVYVVADAVGNRNPNDAVLALERMRAAGVEIISKEMALFEWVHQAGTPEFKQLSKEFLR